MDSIITKYRSNCMFCGRPTTFQHHFLFGRGVRQLAEEDGIKGPVCEDCHVIGNVLCRIHDNVMAEKMSKIIGQLSWEKRKVAEGMAEDEAREAFRKRYGESWL